MEHFFSDKDAKCLAEKLAAVSELAAGMAHEIRNPLTSIRGFLQLLQSKYEPDALEQEYFTIIFKELDRINNIIKEFLTLSKPSQAQKQIISFEQLMAEIMLLVEQEAIMYEISLNVDIDPNIPQLCLNPAKFKQVILNIANNAFQAAGAGGKVTIRSYFDSVSKQVVTIIKDNGCGIPPEKLKFIFEPFYTTKENGTGLGLSLCCRIIKNHGGKITAKSTVGKGSRFHIFLPVP